MVIAYWKVPLHNVGFRSINLVASLELDAGVWHQRLGHMNEKGMNIMLSKDELSGLKSIDLDFCEDCIYEKQRRVNFSKVRKTLKAKRLELVHTKVWGKVSVLSRKLTFSSRKSGFILEAQIGYVRCV